MGEQDFWQAVLYLHLLAMAFFVGGQLVFGIAVVPVLRGDPDPERTRMRAVARRFGYGSLAALGVLILTGWAMVSTLPEAARAGGGDPARLAGDRLARPRAGSLIEGLLAMGQTY
jgi:putative copper export protein